MQGLNNILEIPQTWFSMKRTFYCSRLDIKKLKNDLFLDQLAFVSKNIPYYRQTFRELNLDITDFKDISDIKLLPILDKKFVIENIEDFFNPKIPRTKLQTSWTSGSTGVSFRSYFDNQSWVRKKYLSKLRSRLFCGLRYSDRVLIINCEKEEKNHKSNRKIIHNLPILNTSFVTAYESPKAVLEKILKFKPTVLYGPHSYIFQLTEEIKKTNTGALKIRLIFTSSELISQNVIKAIKSVFNADIFDIYGSTEFKEVAWECPNKIGYHINEDEVHLEIVTEEHENPNKDIGSIVLTDLRNKGFPLIRYKIGDKGILCDEHCDCGCGFALMKPRDGRLTDYVLLPSGEKLSPYKVEVAIESVRGIRQYQFVQKTFENFTIHIICDPADEMKIESQVKTELKKFMIDQANFEIKFVSKIHSEHTGKFKLIKSELA